MVSGSLTVILYHPCGRVPKFVNTAALVARTFGNKAAPAVLETRLDVHRLPSLYNILRHRSGYPGRHRPHRSLLPLQGSLAGAPGGRGECAGAAGGDG